MSDESPEAAIARDSITDFEDLYARQTSIHGYRVLHLFEDEPNTAYQVNIQHLHCDCDDAEYNRSGGEVCKHLAYALFHAHKHMDIGDILTYDLQNVVREARDTLKTVERYGTGLEADAAADGTTATTTASESPSVDPVSASEDLLAAFDEVVEDMQVTATENYVWFQTGKDTPDEWPYPGGDETFKVVTGPDVVEYVHDGSPDWADSPHEWIDEKPGEWYKNAIRPEDVPTYIEEVLE